MNKDPSTLIQNYKRRQQLGPFLLWGAVIVIIVAGLILLIAWLLKPDSPMMTMLASATPTSTITPSPTNTPLPTETPTETLTPTSTLTPTAAAPFDYTVQAGDSLFAIAQKFNLGPDGIQLILLLNPYNPDPATKRPGIDPTTQNIYPGLIITIPNPGMQLPTATPIPSNVPRGTKITYTIQSGDTLASIASKFNSTQEDIQKLNNITDPNLIQVGQQIFVRVNLVTPTAAPKPTITQGPSPTPPSPFTATPAGAPAVPTASATP